MFCKKPKLRIKGHNGKCYEPLSLDTIPYYGYYAKLSDNPKIKIQKPESLNKFITIPCGHCFPCRVELYNDWSTRCWLEAKTYENNQFITLTYNDKHLPKYGLSPSDLSKFIHSLREHYRRKYGISGIRFFACGEYGGNTYRAHYHILFFNCPPFGDEKLYKKNELKQSLYKSDILTHLWGKGFCSIGTVTRQSCDYVCRYLVKPTYGKKPHELANEFRSMSKMKGGLGLNYLRNNLGQIISNDTIKITGKISVKLPYYFDRKIKEIIGKERFENEIAIPRAEKAKAYFEREMARTGLNEVGLNNLQIKNFKASIKKLEQKFEIYEKENNEND